MTQMTTTTRARSGRCFPFPSLIKWSHTTIQVFVRTSFDGMTRGGHRFESCTADELRDREFRLTRGATRQMLQGPNGWSDG